MMSPPAGSLPGPVPGRLVGRERHVLAETDGTYHPPTWLDGLEHQRAWTAAQAERILTPAPTTLLRALPRVTAVVAVAATAAVGGMGRMAPRLRRLFTFLGPTFIKFGQLISGGSGLFPAALVEEFASFRDRVPPEDFAHVQRVLAEELPGGLDLFASFEETPLASASIAQVHGAVLRDGRRVVVKIQRPGLTERVERDLRWIATLFAYLDRWVPPARAGNLPAVIEYFTETLLEELDFRLEAENQLDVAEAVSRSEVAGTVVVPRPHAELVTRRVLVMERIDGFDSTDGAGITAAGIDTAAMLRNGFIAFAGGALRYGVFHGDLHPGNIRVTAEGRYAILDYGIVGRLSDIERHAFARMMGAAATGDVREQMAAFRDMGAFPPDADLDALVADIDPALLPTDMRIPDFSTVGASMRDSLQLMMRHHFRLPKLLVLLTKNLIFADDARARLAPDLDLMADAAPLFLAVMAELRDSA